MPPVSNFQPNLLYSGQLHITTNVQFPPESCWNLSKLRNRNCVYSQVLLMYIAWFETQCAFVMSDLVRSQLP